MTYTIRSGWDEAYGVFDLRMPRDGTLPPLAGTFPQSHLNGFDCLQQDGGYGPRPFDIGAPGGPGILMGYSHEDTGETVRQLSDALQRNSALGLRSNKEHHRRNYLYDEVGWEQTRGRVFASRIIGWDAIITGELSDDPATIHLDDPGWKPNTLAQHNAEVKARPHLGSRLNGREFGWAAHGRGLRRKVDRFCSTTWDAMLLQTCELAAMPFTGQICTGPNTGGQPTVPENVCYTMHQGILVHGVLAICYRLGLIVPQWVLNWMDAIERVNSMSYGGYSSPPKFTYTQGRKLLTAIGSDQGGDPAHGWWSSNCVALAKMQPEKREHWLARATRFGPTTALDASGKPDEQARVESMLYRGAVG